MTQVTQELLDKIERENAKSIARQEATPGLWCSMHPTDISFYEDHKIFTVYDFDLFYALAFYCEVHKDLYHFNPHWEGLTLIQVKMLIDQFPRYVDHATGDTMIGYEYERYDEDEMEQHNFESYVQPGPPPNNVFAELLK